MIEYKMLEPTGNVEDDVKVLAADFGSILDKFWEAEGRAFYGTENWAFDPVPFTQMWRERLLTIFSAKDGGNPVGFLMGIRVQPFFTSERVFQVEAIYGATPEITSGLISELMIAFKYWPETSLVVPRVAAEKGIPLRHTKTKVYEEYKR